MIDVERLDSDLLAVFSDKTLVVIPTAKGVLITESDNVTETENMLSGLGYNTDMMSVYKAK